MSKTRDVGDIVGITDWQGECGYVPPVEHEIVAIDGDLGWVRRVDQPRSMGRIIDLNRTTFIRSTATDSFEHAADPFLAIEQASEKATLQ